LEFRDEDLEKKIDRANETFDANVAKIWEENIEPYQDDLDKIKEEIEPILEKYNRNLESLNNELQDEVKPIKNRLENLRHVITFTIDDIEVDLPEKPHAEVCSHPSNEWLFDSKRDFLEQMKHYRQSRERAR
jgi:DNA repair exonuclease SbcCD ATPase subunit